MKKIIVSLIFIFLLNIQEYKAQEINLLGSLPSFSLQGPVNNYLRYNFNIDSQINAVEKVYNEKIYPRQVNNINLTAGIGFQYSPHLHLAASFLFRFTKPFDNKQEYELRPWQQFTLTHQINKYRVRNRFRIEERWFTFQDNFDLRLRYQLSTDFPLAGEKIDVGEAYLNLSYELLSMPTQEDFLTLLNQRPYAGVGMKLNNNNRVEIGPELRTQIIESGNRQNVWFLRLSWSYLN